MITNQLNTLRQSSARHWRIGQWEDCRTHFIFYAGTAQEVAVKHMSAKLKAALYLEGDVFGSGFASEVDDSESLEQAIMRNLEKETE
jgi:hypothetical protein